MSAMSTMSTIHDAHFRCVHARDHQKVRAFLHRLSPATVRARYLGGLHLTDLGVEREVARLVRNERAYHTVLVAVADNEIRGIAEYVVDAPGYAEVGLVVEDEFQG